MRRGLEAVRELVAGLQHYQGVAARCRERDRTLRGYVGARCSAGEPATAAATTTKTEYCGTSRDSCTACESMTGARVVIIGGTVARLRRRTLGPARAVTAQLPFWS